MESVASTAASTRPARRARGRGLHPKGSDRRQNSREFCRLPEYLEAAEAEALIEHAPNAPVQTAADDPVARRTPHLGGPES